MAKGKKTGGRKAGTPNKATRITREIINDLANGMLDQVKADIADLEPHERVKTWIKLCEFLAPKPQAISLDITSENERTIEDRLIELSEMNEE